MSGSKWYNQQATRAVNQAIGRVIRHVQDYGAILLMDERYIYSSNKGQVSKWLRNQIKVPKNFAELDTMLNYFFKDMINKGFVPKIQQLQQIKLEFDDSIALNCVNEVKTF